MKRRGGRIVLSRRRALAVLPIWIACVAWMWLWWLNPERINFLPLFIPLTLALFYDFALLPSIFLYFVFHAKQPAKRVAQKNLKVAVITLCVPSKESIDIVERQLKAMSEITYPHDSWVLDEGNSKEIRLLAKKYGVIHFTRKGIKKYNQDGPPFKKKTKAGNVNAWLSFVKRRKYDYFVQFDVDHIPQPDYLHKTLGHFRDPKVAWVQAPSVYNNRNSWTALGAAEQELVLQGPLQMGFYGFSETPFIIGSHCTYRMSAIREIDGFQPTRAEDHLDTVMLSSRGYKGVFIPEIIAQGDGPESLNTYLAQQFAWAYSMFQVLIAHTPKLIKTMTPKSKLQFLFAQTWYPLWSLSYAVMFFTPLIALLINKDVASIPKNDFAIHFAPLFIFGFVIWWAAKPLMQPQDVTLSWRGMILHAVRWPVIIWAVISAALKIKKPYMITPKGKFSGRLAPSLDTYVPFLLLGFLSASSVIFAGNVYGDTALEGQMVFAVVNALFMLIICSVDLNILLRISNPEFKKLKKLGWAKPVTAVASLLFFVSLAISTSPYVDREVAYAQNKKEINAEIINTANIKDKKTANLINEIHKLPETKTHQPTVGIYNPSSLYKTDQPYIRHSFADWNQSDIVARELYISLKYENTPLMTIEPKGDEDGARLLADISAGKYDEKLDELSQVFGATDKPVYVRFAHEMDLAEVYPWGNQDPELYINAHHHVVDYMRSHNAENVRWVWSPAGNHGAEEYYPGDDYVDVIGTTVLYDQYFYGYNQPTFWNLVAERQHLQNLGKPVWIVEFGAGKASPAYQQLLINSALSNYKAAGYDALIYLNIADSNIVGPDYRIADRSYVTEILSKSVMPKASGTAENTEIYNIKNIPGTNTNTDLLKLPVKL